MTIEKSNPITSHELTLMPPTAHQPQPFGWIRLLNGTADAGYVYLDPNLVPTDPQLSGPGNSYIVTAMPFASMDSLLSILRNERNLQIRFFDPQVAGVSPSVFIESAVSTNSNAHGLRLPAEAAKEVEKQLKELLNR